MALQKKSVDGQYHVPDFSTLNPLGDAYVYDRPPQDGSDGEEERPGERIVVLYAAGIDQAGKTRLDLNLKILEVVIRPDDKHSANGLLWLLCDDPRDLVSVDILNNAITHGFEPFMKLVLTVGWYGT